MTPDPDTLGALATRCEAGVLLPYMAIFEATNLADPAGTCWFRVRKLLGADAYLDAVAALTEAMLPGWRVVFVKHANVDRWFAHLQTLQGDVTVQGIAPTEPLARLAAALRAKAAEIRGHPEACSVCGGDCGSANPPVLYCPMREGRRSPQENTNR
jgi:hypothetical protein